MADTSLLAGMFRTYQDELTRQAAFTLGDQTAGADVVQDGRRLPPDVVDDELVARNEHVPAHRPAHNAQARQIRLSRNLPVWRGISWGARARTRELTRSSGLNCAIGTVAGGAGGGGGPRLAAGSGAADASSWV